MLQRFTSKFRIRTCLIWLFVVFVLKILTDILFPLLWVLIQDNAWQAYQINMDILNMKINENTTVRI
jgi:hypothetical protein